MKAFVNDCCDVKKGLSVPVDILWQTQNLWAKNSGIPAYSKRRLILETKYLCPAVKRERKRLDSVRIYDQYKHDITTVDNRRPILEGIDLREEYKTICAQQDIPRKAG